MSVPRICSEFEEIQKKVLEVPESTENIAQIEEYIKFTKTKGVAQLSERLKVNSWMSTGICICWILDTSLIYLISF